MTTKNAAMVTRRDFDDVVTDLATFTFRDGKVKRLRMYVSHYDEVPTVTYQVFYQGYVIAPSITDITEATMIYNGAGAGNRMKDEVREALQEPTIKEAAKRCAFEEKIRNNLKFPVDIVGGVC